MEDTGAKEGWEGVTAAANESEAALIAGFLESRGIPARVVDRSFHQTPTENEDLTGIEIAVPSGRASEAREELARREKEWKRTPPGSDLITDDETPGD
ncbi:MAG TPA: hypothetical protein VMN04_12245 [Thermoanaerobaculia bacterium]|nr:hypothetical protein [Thermoanaerobaculia bacterium]